ncbi:hypothetical protein TREES_T100018027 [Tupaia chinensis]|uniref:Uncharacterized protein n=1 Tax=Tupaia chinensis TaxID=246437 RepID=L9JDZ6_TUPCH|nr:hypothetical protein TREES_T100018027 [Tupaia chinensis]
MKFCDLPALLPCHPGAKVKKEHNLHEKLRYLHFIIVPYTKTNATFFNVDEI